ncbi:MAG: divalent-cation tolerance protein CutA [Firmicutes bacterium]|jgi:periplasmic divalent cation tolerance protein|nr:divalent-cation tolerance protein CutA [Bacillota bacterium]
MTTSYTQNNQFCEITITAPPTNWINEFCRNLVEKRLCACANIDRNIHSVYRWENQIHEEEESRARIHTLTSLSDKIIEAVKREHPYQEPSVIVTPIIGGSDTYLKWILKETL